MQSFKDSENREWVLSINLATAEALEKIEFHIESALDGSLFKELGDHRFLFKALWVLVEPQAQKKEVTREQFAAAIAGDVLRLASDAMVGAITDFFPHPGQRNTIRTLWQKGISFLDAEMAKIEAQAQALDLASLSVPETSGPPSGAVVESSATPTTAA
jgi:hypothetical protein